MIIYLELVMYSKTIGLVGSHFSLNYPFVFLAILMNLLKYPKIKIFTLESEDYLGALKGIDFLRINIEIMIIETWIPFLKNLVHEFQIFKMIHILKKIYYIFSQPTVLQEKSQSKIFNTTSVQTASQIFLVSSVISCLTTNEILFINNR